MKFRTNRTSLLDSEKPCDSAVSEHYLKREYYDYKSFEEYEKRWEEDFTSRGINHAVVMSNRGNPKGIERFHDCTDWFVEINTLEELMRFEKQEGHLIVSTDDGIPTIEIYDWWRE